ncbi:MAG: SDR family NAD(P)-dependent oxidoreductase, partial [Gammaproteobacteria bacterium]
AYASSKAALVGLTRSMAVELGGRVRVNALCPAAIDTEMLRQGFADSQPGLQELSDYHPSKSIGDPAEVAKIVLCLADPDFRFLHGAVIGLDGGIAARLHDPD